MKRYLCIDYGRARIGLAISETSLMGRPLSSIPNRGTAKNLAAISNIWSQHIVGAGGSCGAANTIRGRAAGGDLATLGRAGIENAGESTQTTTSCGCLLGIPLYKDGREGPMAREVREFGAKLSAALGVEIEFHNEFLSSVEAEDYIKNVLGITNPKKIKELVDAVAAAMILSEYLEEKNGKK